MKGNGSLLKHSKILLSKKTISYFQLKSKLFTQRIFSNLATLTAMQTSTGKSVGIRMNKVRVNIN